VRLREAKFDKKATETPKKKIAATRGRRKAPKPP